MRNALPWILLALVAGGWIGATLFGASPSEDADEIATLRTSVATMRAELEALRTERRAGGPVLEKTAEAPPASPTAGSARPERRVEDTAALEAEVERQQQIRTLRKGWYDAIRSLKDGDARATALAEMRSAFDSDDATRRLAALQLARWVGNVEYDHAAWRAAILPHAESADPETRVAAMIALAYVQPEEGDLARWPEAAKAATRQSAEEMAHAIVRTAGGDLRGDAAESVLHLLRDGTDIKKAFVIRGLQSVKVWDPAVEARLVEIVRAAPAHDYDSGYYFHFITPRLDPKSDAVVDLMLDKVGEGKSEIQTLVRGFQGGLDETQKARAADRLLDYAENANAYTVRFIAQALRHVASARHEPRLEALIEGENVDKYAKGEIETAIQMARRRQ